MPPFTDTHPGNTANVRPDGLPYPAQPHFDGQTKCEPLNLGHDKPLPPIPCIRDATALEASLQRQRDALHPSFQTTPVTVGTKTQLLRNGKFWRPVPHIYAQRRELLANRRSLPPPYTAVDPNAPPARHSRTVRWVDRPVDNSHKRRGNVGPGYPLDVSSNANHVASTHRQAAGGRVRCFFRRCKKWLQGVRNT